MPHWLRRFKQLILLLASAGMPVQAAEAGPQKISLQEARRLVYEVVKVHNCVAEISRTQNPYDREFFYFEVIAANPVASPMVGHFAVNPWTGDVWNSVLCERVTLPSLQKMQEKVRKRSRLREEEYLRLRAKKPLCA
jgi:hypothetical protein